MKSTKDCEELGIITFEKAKEVYDNGHRYMSWWGYNKDGEIVDYKDEEFTYPAPSLSYSKI